MTQTIVARTVSRTSLCPKVNARSGRLGSGASSANGSGSPWSGERDGSRRTLWAYHHVQPVPKSVKNVHMTIRKGAPESTGISATPWAMAMLNGFIHDVAKPIWVAT